MQTVFGVVAVVEKKVSIIVRTRNEERWIDKCLEAIANQTYQNKEVVLVDNASTDATLAKSRRFGTKTLSITEFRPGLALNDGVRASTGEVIVCLSAHCIPASADWLANLITPLADSTVAGVYGRQEPLPFSHPQDKRDLLTVFGLDRKVQFRDPFFHNANSALLRSTWEQLPFDEQVKNLEDRMWGQAAINSGLSIVYEPAASVFHWHGIHQGMDVERAHGVVRVMEQIHGESQLPDFLKVQEHTNLVVIPVREQPGFALQRELLIRTIQQAKGLTGISQVVVSTESESLAEVARRAGADVPFVRPKELAEASVDVLEVVKHAMTEVEKSGLVSDAVVLLEISYPLRHTSDVESMLKQLFAEGLEAVIPGRRERRGLWSVRGTDVNQIGEGFMPRDRKSTSAYIGLLGYGAVLRSAALRANPFHERVGVYEIKDEFAAMEFRFGIDEALATQLLKMTASAQ